MSSSAEWPCAEWLTQRIYTCVAVFAVPRRRAKRLKKLNRMMTSTAAQLATDRWRRHTYMATAAIVVAHVICFVVLLTQINARYQ